MHADAGATGGHHRRDFFKRQKRHSLEEIADFRMLCNGSWTHVEKLCNAGDKHGQDIALVFLRMLLLAAPVVLQKAAYRHFLKQLHKLITVSACKLNKLIKGIGGAQLHLERDLHHVVIKDIHKPPVFRVVLSDGLDSQLLRDSVGDFFTELE